jgi:DNA-directed RNA polymerase specialized sigma24 family protein
MDNTSARRFFLQPTAAPQRLYEALRAVFLEGCRQKDIADRFGYDYAAFRRQVTRFRARCAAGQPPPFSRQRPTRACRFPTGRSGEPSPQRSPIAVP